MRFKKVENDVIPILKANRMARCDDMTLYACYAYKKIQDEPHGKDWLQKVFSDRRYRLIHGIAPYETVSRVRRKLQADHDNLRPSKADIEERKQAEKEYKAYAKQKGGAL